MNWVRRLLLSSTLVSPALVGLAGCATILGYDDLSPRIDSSVAQDGGVETSADVSDSGPTSCRVPSRPDGDPTPSGTGKTLWLAAKHFYFGSKNLAGVAGETAWRGWGYDLDKVCTGEKESRENIGTCRRVDGASQDMLVDGDCCRDNNFGSKIVGLIGVYSTDFESNANQSILEGNSTWVLALDDVDDGPDDAYAPGRLYRTYPDRTRPPAFDGSDVPVARSDSIVAGDITRPITRFPNAYIKGNVWVSSEGAAFQVDLPMVKATDPNVVFSIPTSLVGGVMTLALDPARGNKHGLGLVAGAIPVTTLETMIRPVALDAKFCPGTPIYVSLMKTLQQYPDLVADAPDLQDTTVVCDAVSFGVGFEVAPVQPIKSAKTPPPPPNPCP